ncbi:MAG: hypothetical protein OEV91_02485 [Desulfobulbaceae bacterium]|nr:hypothetical protein [Desulfobulbaceae bacterium]
MQTKEEFSEEYVKYVFSEEEKREIAEKMAQTVTEANDLEEQKKAVAKDFDGRIQTAKNLVHSSDQKLNSGYEMRNIKCLVEKDYEARTATYTRTDNGEIVRKRVLSVGELQMTLPASEEAA